MRSDLLGPAERKALAHISRLVHLKEVLPGERLPTVSELTRTIGVSRPVVLQAVKRLQATGEIEVPRGRAGMRAALGNGKQYATRRKWFKREYALIHDTALLRELLEPAIARRLAEQGIGKAVAGAARRLIEAMRHSGPQSSDGEYAEHLGMDTEFHFLLAQAAGVRQAQDLVDSMRAVICPVFDLLERLPGRIAASTDEHSALLVAIETREVERAGQLMFDHVHNATVVIEKLSGRFE